MCYWKRIFLSKSLIFTNIIDHVRNTDICDKLVAPIRFGSDKNKSYHIVTRVNMNSGILNA